MNITGTLSNDLLFGTTLSDVINGLAGTDRLEGLDGNDILNGGDGDDRGFSVLRDSSGVVHFAVAGLFGGAGNDTLNGGAGDDFLSPGEGNYTIDGGTELDVLALDYTTSVTPISVTYTNIAGTTAGGNTIRNVESVAIKGGSGNDVINVTATSGAISTSAYGNIIDGGAGNDTISSGSGTDLLVGGAGDDVLNGGAGNDRGFSNYTTVTGSSTSQIAGLFGGAGNDTLNGGAGDDFLSPGEGNYTIDGGTELDVLALDYTTATAPISVTYTNVAGTTAGGNTIRNVESVAIKGGSGNDVINVTATSGAISSSAYGSFIEGGAGNDTISSGSGIDLLVGGAGDDILNGGAGNDRNLANYTTVTGSTTTQVAGLFGGAGNDTLNGGAGADTMIGGTGNDIYIVDSTGDVVTETSTLPTEIDTIQSSVNYTLVLNVEKLTLTGTAAINGTGNILNNTIIGNNAANILYGGAGNDAFTGGLGADIFQFKSKTEGIDTISDFTAGDKIAISAAGFGGGLAGTAISASQFRLGAAATTASQRVMYNSATGGLFFDADGSGAGAAFQFATLLNKPTLGATNFLVI